MRRGELECSRAEAATALLLLFLKRCGGRESTAAPHSSPPADPQRHSQAAKESYTMRRREEVPENAGKVVRRGGEGRGADPEEGPGNGHALLLAAA